MGLEGKNIFFTDETRINTTSNIKGESLRETLKGTFRRISENY